jgi:SAM-dependent methyltransferase
LGSSFGAAATAYAEHRPDYAQAAVRWAVERAPGSRVLDLGAGTGKLTATLVSLGAEVIAVEPDPAMLKKLRRALPTVRTLAGSAEAMPLPDASVDAVLVGNAMHWFDMNVAGPEDSQSPRTRRHPGRPVERLRQPGRLGCRTRKDQRKGGRWPAGHVQQLARRDGRSPPPKQWLNRPVRLAGAGRIPAWAATDRRLPRRDVRDEGGNAGHARTGTRGRAPSDPRFPREQTGDHTRPIHPADADRRAPRQATLRSPMTTIGCAQTTLSSYANSFSYSMHATSASVTTFSFGLPAFAAMESGG